MWHTHQGLMTHIQYQSAFIITSWNNRLRLSNVFSLRHSPTLKALLPKTNEHIAFLSLSQIYWEGRERGLRPQPCPLCQGEYPARPEGSQKEKDLGGLGGPQRSPLAMDISQPPLGEISIHFQWRDEGKTRFPSPELPVPSPACIHDSNASDPNEPHTPSTNEPRLSVPRAQVSCHRV